MQTFTKEEMISAFCSGWLNGINDPNSMEAGSMTVAEWDKWLKKWKNYRVGLAEMYIEETLYRKE